MNKITVVCHKDHSHGYEDFEGKCLLCVVDGLLLDIANLMVQNQNFAPPLPSSLPSTTSLTRTQCRERLLSWLQKKWLLSTETSDHISIDLNRRSHGNPR